MIDELSDVHAGYALKEEAMSEIQNVLGHFQKQLCSGIGHYLKGNSVWNKLLLAVLLEL